MESKTDTILAAMAEIDPEAGIEPSEFYDRIESEVPRASATALTSQLVRSGRIAKGEDGRLRPVPAGEDAPPPPPRRPRRKPAPQPEPEAESEETVSDLVCSVNLRENVCVIEHGGGSLVLGWRDLDELLTQAERARAALAEV